MIKKIGVLPLVLLALLMSQPIFADTGAGQSKTSMCACKHPMHKMVASLQLGHDQQTKIKTIKAQTKNLDKGYWQQMAAITVQMNNMITADTVDEAKLDALVKQKTGLYSKIIKNRIMTKNQIYHVLTAQQQQQFTALMKQSLNKAEGTHANCQCQASAAQ